MTRSRIAVIALMAIFLIGGSASGDNIAWVTFHGDSDDGSVPSANAAAAGFTVAPDKDYTDLLIGAGHTINRITVPAAGNNVALLPDTLAELNAADLVIIGRSVNSGSFQEDVETMSWNTEVTSPIMITTGYILRDVRLALTTGDTMVDITGPTRLVANIPGHPIFDGITLDGNNETGTILDVVTAPITGDPLQLGTSINNNSPIAGGSLIASITSDNAAAPGGLVIAEYPAGLATGNPGQSLSSKRLVFLTGSRENGITGDAAGIIDLSDDGRQMFLNAVTYLTTLFTPGDTNGNGIGGEYPADFDPIRNNFRKSPRTREEGDLTGNGVVDFADFREWKAAALGSGTSLEGIDVSFLGAVPEPSSIVLLAMTCLSVGAMMRQRRSV